MLKKVRIKHMHYMKLLYCNVMIVNCSMLSAIVQFNVKSATLQQCCSARLQYSATVQCSSARVQHWQVHGLNKSIADSPDCSAANPCCCQDTLIAVIIIIIINIIIVIIVIININIIIIIIVFCNCFAFLAMNVVF